MMEIIFLIILIACAAAMGGIPGLIANRLLVRRRESTIFYDRVSPWRRTLAAILALALVAGVWKVIASFLAEPISSDGSIYFIALFNYFITPIAAIFAVVAAVRTKPPRS